MVCEQRINGKAVSGITVYGLVHDVRACSPLWWSNGGQGD